MSDSDSAPQGGWGDPPAPPAPAAPSGQAPSTPQPSPTPPTDKPSGPKGFDREAYLSTLPAAEREAKASLSDEILRAESGRTMLRSDYDRKRGTESAELKALRAQNELLMQQNQQMLELAQGAQAPGEPPPSLEEIGQKLYEADNPADYAKGVTEIVGQVVGDAVGRAIDSNPAIRQLQSGIALRSARSSSGADFEEADFAEAQRTLEEDLAARGARIEQLDPDVLRTFYAPHLRAARAERLLKNGSPAGQAPTPPAQPAAPVTLPVSGSGASVGTKPQGEDNGYGPKSTLNDRVNETMRRLNLTPQQIREMAANF